MLCLWASWGSEKVLHHMNYAIKVCFEEDGGRPRENPKTLIAQVWTGDRCVMCRETGHLRKYCPQWKVNCNQRKDWGPSNRKKKKQGSHGILETETSKRIVAVGTVALTDMQWIQNSLFWISATLNYALLSTSYYPYKKLLVLMSRKQLSLQEFLKVH